MNKEDKLKAILFQILLALENQPIPPKSKEWFALMVRKIEQL